MSQRHHVCVMTRPTHMRDWLALAPLRRRVLLTGTAH
jgi:hypothetical protein